MVIPFQAGGLNDSAGRAINQSLGQLWNQPIVVENRVGANGNIGMEACAKAPPDGYTICLPTGVVMALNPFAYTKLPFEPLEMVPVIHVGVLDQVITTNASLPVHNVRELVDYAKGKPGVLNWASLGSGSTGHLYMVWMQAKTGATFVHVPYKTSAQLQQALLAGEVQISTNTPAAMSPHIKAGKLRPLATVSGHKRPALLPDTPTFAEQGYDLDFRNWLGLFLPKGTPSEIARRWNGEVQKLLADAAFEQKFFDPLSVSATGGSPEELAAFLRANQKTAAELAKIANLRFD
jgi:tripartite-type tricarboxylate transporter receptor subunit TctC